MTRSFSWGSASGTTPLLSRRQWLQLTAAGALGGSVSGWLEPLANASAANPQRRRSCILLWMDGGPTQTDTFDLKPGHENGGVFKEIATPVPGIKISEHLPQLASWMKHMAIIRSMDTREEDHGRATFLLHTGYNQEAANQYPPLGAIVSHELGQADAILPNSVCIAPDRQFAAEAYGPGFLGPMYAPLVIADKVQPQNGAAAYEEALRVPYLIPPTEGGAAARSGDRIDLLQKLDRDFTARYPGTSGHSHQAAYGRAVRLMRSEAGKAFDLTAEPAKVRDAYGRNLFGQGCLIARRLVERGVPFVEVTLGSLNNGGQLAWDTHNDNFETVKRLSQILDPAWGSLMRDLKERGLLDTTLIIWMGEFGRTPKLSNGSGGGRDHYAAAWSTVLAGGGIRGGQVVGKTSPDGMKITDRPVKAADFLATICLALGMDPTKMNTSNTGRPIPLAEENAQPMRELVG